MDNIAGKKSGLTWAVHISVAGAGAAVGDADLRAVWCRRSARATRSSTSGWWQALTTQESSCRRSASRATRCRADGAFVIEGQPLRQRGDDGQRLGHHFARARRPMSRATWPTWATGMTADGAGGWRLRADLARHDRGHAPAARLRHRRHPARVHAEQLSHRAVQPAGRAERSGRPS